MSLNTILATTPLVSTNYILKATGTTIGNSLIWDNGTNVGIGNTNTSYTLDVSGTGRFTGALTAGTTGNLAIFGTSNTSDKYISITNSIGNFEIGNNSTQHYLQGNGALPITFLTNATERMRITSGGLVGIGTTSPLGTSGTEQTLHLSSGSANYTTLYVTNGANSVKAIVATQSSQGVGLFGMQSNHPALFVTNDTERMRITSDGNVLINQTTDQLSTWKLQVTGNARFNDFIIFPTAAAANNGEVYLGQGNKYTSSFTANDFLIINQGSSGAGIVQITAGVVTNGVYLARNANAWSAVSSDARNKKDFEKTQGLAEVLQIEPVKYNYIWDEEGETKRLGFTAQNLQSLIPEMVIATGKKADDGSDYLTITPDYLLPVLVKAIQEQQIQIQNLQEQINILAK